jgi:hypothetical protein
VSLARIYGRMLTFTTTPTHLRSYTYVVCNISILIVLLLVVIKSGKYFYYLFYNRQNNRGSHRKKKEESESEVDPLRVAIDIEKSKRLMGTDKN